jgi:hypothetical protein
MNVDEARETARMIQDKPFGRVEEALVTLEAEVERLRRLLRYQPECGKVSDRDRVVFLDENGEHLWSTISELVDQRNRFAMRAKLVQESHARD